MANEMEKFVIELKEVSVIEDYYIFDFLAPSGIKFIEGQYGVFMHIDKDIEGRKVRAFSIASSVNENVFKVGTKIPENPSDFKVKMRDLEIGETMMFNGPMGNFTLEKGFDSVFVGGGIGITPIRGLLRQAEELKLNNDTVLIYSEARSIYPFKEEFDKMDLTEIYYKNNVENTKVAIDNASLKYLNNAFYYISGSPGFITGIKEQLLNNGIELTNIKFDRFTGY